jgi:hypothetical protein
MTREINELNANGGAISRLIIYHALRMAGLLPEPPEANLKEWAWKMHWAQRSETLFSGIAQTSLIPLTGEAPPEFKEVEVQECLWFMAEIPIRSTDALPQDVVELWHKDDLVVFIKNLYVTPMASADQLAHSFAPKEK